MDRGRVTVKIGEFEAITVGLSGVTCYVASRLLDERVRDALKRILNVFRPRDVLLGLSVPIRGFVPIDESPADAQPSSGAQLFRDRAPSATATDWALLFDEGYRVGARYVPGKFGVVSEGGGSREAVPSAWACGVRWATLSDTPRASLPAPFSRLELVDIVTGGRRAVRRDHSGVGCRGGRDTELSEEVKNGDLTPKTEKEAHG